MKLRLPFTLLIACLMLSFASCKKDKPIKYPIEGLWIGTYTVDRYPDQKPLFYSFSVKPGGTILTESKGSDGISYYSEGTWALTGNKFSFNITTITFKPLPIKQSGMLTFEDSGKMTDGTWQDTDNPYIKPGNSGKFSTMNRVN